MKNLGQAMILAAMMGGCSAAPEVREYDIGGGGARPASLAELASGARGAGGFVLRGTVASVAPAMDELVVDRPTAELNVAYPMVEATISVTDAMGSAIGATAIVLGGDGDPQIVDDDGIPSSEWVVSGTGSTDSEHVWMPSTGEHVFFVVPRGEGHQLMWVTGVVDGVVAGDGTADGVDVPIAELAL